MKANSMSSAGLDLVGSPPTARFISGLRPWHVLSLFTLILLGLGLSYIDHHSTVDVRVASPSFRDMESTVSTMGKVVPVGEFQARANFPGMVEAVHVQVGQKVLPGQLLVSLKDSFASSRVAAAQAALQSVEVGYENLRNNGSKEDRINFAADYEHAQTEQALAMGALSTLRNLQQSGSASGAEIFGAEQRLRNATAAIRTLDAKGDHRYSPEDIASWAAKVSEAKATLRAERSTLANAEMTSPIAGTVYLISVKPYDFVSAGADLIRVADLSRLDVKAMFDEAEIGKLVVGQPVTLRWDGRPEKTWKGHVQHVPMAVVNSGTRSVGEALIALDSTAGDLPANTNVNVSVTTGQRTHVLTIPREALHIDGTNSYAYRDVGGRLVKSMVTIGMVSLNDAEITHGLGQTDVVALHALTGMELRDDLKIGEVR